MSNVYDDRRHKLVTTLESLKIQGVGLLSRGDVTEEELGAFKDLGETLLSGSEHTLLSVEDVSGVDATTDLELSLESLDQIIGKLSSDAMYSAEALSPEKEDPVIADLLLYKAGLEGMEKVGQTLKRMKDIELTMTKQERDDAYAEQDRVLTNAYGANDSVTSMVIELLMAPVKAAAKAGGKGLIKAGGAAGEIIVDAVKGIGRDVDQTTTTHESLQDAIRIIDHAIDFHRKNTQ